MQNTKYKIQDTKHRGFTLIEAVVVTFIVIVGIIGVLTVSQHAVLIVYDARDKLTAVYLAKEGAEVVRNRRDQNWLRGGVAWNDGIENTDLRYLKINTDSLYNYTIGDLTKFRRKITVTNIDLHPADGVIDAVRVRVVVEWSGLPGHPSHIFELEEVLYNWR